MRLANSVAVPNRHVDSHARGEPDTNSYGDSDSHV